MQIDSSDKKIALISTLPKSGTWYCHTFFWCYDELLANSEAYNNGTFKPNLAKAFRNQQISKKNEFSKTLAIDQLYVCHSLCPGFYELDDVLESQWEALHFPVNGYNYGEQIIQQKNEWDLLNPFVNPDARIIYLYRNPLDHFVSWFNHAQNHLDDSHRFKILYDGTREPINNLHDFIFSFGGLSAFIKHYYPFRQMQRRFPENVKLISYENLITKPSETFNAILTFFDAAPDTDNKRRLFHDALEMCSKESLSELESKLNISLANDQQEGKKHIRGGEIGKWKKFLTHNEIEAIEFALNSFDISLKEFALIEGAATASTLPWLEELSSQHYKMEFFTHQLAEMGKYQKNPDIDNLISLHLKLQQAQDTIEEILTSKSWRLTLPLRMMNVFIRKIQHALAFKRNAEQS